MSLQVQGVAYVHPDKEPLFQNISFTVQQGEKCAIIGNNGIGKSTLLSIMAGKTACAAGMVACDSTPYLIPQHFGQYDSMTVAEALGVAEKLAAMEAILGGQGTEHDFTLLNDEWDIEDRLAEAFARWHLNGMSPCTPMGKLCGGEKTKAFLAGLNVFQPSVALMDEPTNHLDATGRSLLYEFVSQTNRTVVVVSHDRTLLDMMPAIYEMSASGMKYYPMSYNMYKETIDAENAAKAARLQNRQKELKKAEMSAQRAMERQQKHASRGEKLSAKKCVARIAMGNMRDKSEASASRLNKMQQEKLAAMKQDLNAAQTELHKLPEMKLDIGNPTMPANKLLVETTDVTFGYPGREPLWQRSPLSISLYSGERVWLRGDNGCGKSTLIKLLTGALNPTSGNVRRSQTLNIVCLDQEYSLIDDKQTVYTQLEAYNGKRPEHELKMLLNRFSLTAASWNKKCAFLSGGERMKLALCCLLVCEDAPDMIIADEPTNNIDISSMDVLAATLRTYIGTLLIVSHDKQFIQDIGIDRTISI